MCITSSLGKCRIVSVYLTASSSKSSFFALFPAKPCSTALYAERSFENKSRPAAVFQQHSHLSSQEHTPPGCNPNLKNFGSKIASSKMIRASQAKAMLNPAPIAGPFNAVIVGKAHRATLKKTLYVVLSLSLSGLIPQRGAPAQEMVPAPVIITYTTLRSDSDSFMEVTKRRQPVRSSIFRLFK